MTHDLTRMLAKVLGEAAAAPENESEELAYLARHGREYVAPAKVPELTTLQRFGLEPIPDREPIDETDDMDPGELAKAYRRSF